ncbi:hypothetical protein EB093_08615 [bacterium]|nr:hypothetical protein [bacterium]
MKNYNSIELWRRENKITGRTYYFNFKIPKDKQNHWVIRNVLRPFGICVYTSKKYYMYIDCMIDACGMITDNKEKFQEYSKHDLEKCKVMDMNCWDLLMHLQRIGEKMYIIE